MFAEPYIYFGPVANILLDGRRVGEGIGGSPLGIQMAFPLLVLQKDTMGHLLPENSTIKTNNAAQVNSETGIEQLFAYA